MAARSSLFRLYHQAAQQASRRLSAVFWLGVLLSGGIYFALGAGFIELFRFIFLHAELLEQEWYLHRYSLYCGGIIAVSCIAVVIGEYFAALALLQRKTAAELAKEMYAKPIDENKHIPRFAMLANIVDEMAVAGGIRPPPVFYLPHDESINAFVLGGKGQSVALVVSNGLLDYLERDEQQAIIAHEFGHIKNEDVFIYAKLSAVLKGYYAISEWRHGAPIVSVAREHIFSGLLRREDGGDTPLDAIRRLLGTTGLILAMLGERIQAAFSREREWMADARAVQYTRNPAALIMAFKKALALQYLQMHPYAMPSNQAHQLFINYFTQMRTHPPLETRIARYGGKVNSQEIEALAFEIRSKKLHCVADNAIEINRQAFVQNAVFPILTIQAAQLHTLPQSLGRLKLRKQLLAFFVYHSGIDSLSLAYSKHIPEAEKAELSQAVAAVNLLPPMRHFVIFQQIVKQYQAQSSTEEHLALWQQIQHIMRDDGKLTFYEICYAAQVQFVLRKPAQHQHYRDNAMAIYEVLRAVASLYHSQKTPWQSQIPDAQVLLREQKQCFAQLIQQSFPLKIPEFYALEMTSQEDLRCLLQALRAVSTLSTTYRQSLWQTLDAHWRRQGNVNLQEVHLRQLLQVLLA